jgi:hypothetical protein
LADAAQENFAHERLRQRRVGELAAGALDGGDVGRLQAVLDRKSVV